MDDHKTPQPEIKFSPKYEWPSEGTQRDCPRCGTSLQLMEAKPTYFGKPWWCPECQWQFSEKDLSTPKA
ncbi:MAG: hypothetical protein ACE5DP_04285 [Fidelibacterota bacterium]